MERDQVTTSDGFTLAYAVSGEGPALLLLHGFGNEQTMWHTSGWVDQLRADYRVITMDLRGCGLSTASATAADYTLERHLADVEAVLDACGAPQSRVWGWSFGGTLGLALAARSARVTSALIAGTYFGRIFSPAYVQGHIDQVAAWAEAAASDSVDRLDLSPAEKNYVRRMNWPAYIARLEAIAAWPWFEPQDMPCPMLLYTGTRDGNVVVQLQRQRQAIEAAGLQLVVFEALTHAQLFTERAVVTPDVVTFLAAHP